MKSYQQNSLMLQEWLLHSEYSLKEFADKCGITSVTLKHVIRTGIMRRDTARKISQGTDGQLKEDDFKIKSSRTKMIVK